MIIEIGGRFPQSVSNSQPIASTSPSYSSNSWWHRTVAELDKLIGYPAEGSSWGPSRPSDEAYSLAASLIFGIDSVEGLSIPRVSATSENGVRVGWRNKGRELDIEIMADGSIEYLLLDHGRKPEEGEIDPTGLKTKINELLRWLAVG